MTSSIIETDLAYAAGIIDGEGLIGIYYSSKNKHGHADSPWALASAFNTNYTLIKWMESSFGGSTFTRDRHANTKPEHKWTITGNECAEFLRLILPYLKIKHTQAQIAMEFQLRRQGSGHRRTASEVLRDDQDIIQMHILNQKGRVVTPEDF